MDSPPPQGHREPGAGREAADAETSVRGSRAWWDDEARAYHAEHGGFLGTWSAGGEFVWCPEGLHEGDWNLLGEDVTGRDVVEIGCGSAPCSRWLAGRGARPVAVDLSAGMLRVGAEAMVAAGEPRVPLVQADARRLPFADDSFDLAFSAFGAIPFVADPETVMAEAARVLRPGGRFVFSVNHPMRWIFRDDPGPAGLEAVFPYFDRSPYVEHDDEGRLVYVEHHRTVGDRIRDLVGAGFVLDELVEPEWPEWLEEEWGQWSPLRGAVFPGTAIFRAHLP